MLHILFFLNMEQCKPVGEEEMSQRITGKRGRPEAHWSLCYGAGD